MSFVYPCFWCGLDNGGQRHPSWTMYKIMIKFSKIKSHVEITLLNQIQNNTIFQTQISIPLVHPSRFALRSLQNDPGQTRPQILSIKIERHWKGKSKEKYLLLLSVVVCVVEPSNIPWAKYITPPAADPHVGKTKENPTLKRVGYKYNTINIHCESLTNVQYRQKCIPYSLFSNNCPKAKN